MATLNIEGRNVQVDDSFLKLSPADQQATVDEIASSFAAPAPDKYQQAAIDEQSDLKSQGIDEGAGLTRRLVHGATLGADSTLMAGALAPVEALKRGVGLSEGYDYAKAREDQILSDARRNTGALGSATELLGGGVAGGGLANAGVTAARALSSAPSLAGRTLATAADAAGLGGVAGFNEGNSLSDRLGNAGQGALTGALVGGALPVAGAVAGGTVSPLISNLMARIDPEGFGRRQVARAIIESGRPTADIAGDVTNAANEGQGVYNVADAMGNSGQRMLSTVARAPGAGRTAVVDALEGRQTGQGRRVANALSEGFGTRMTPDQLSGAMTAERGAMADDAYGAVRNDAQPVDVQGVLDHIDANVPTEPAAPDTISGRLQRYRRMLTNGDEENPENLSDFAQVQRVRSELSDDIQNARQGGQGNRARMLGQVLQRLDTSLENASQGFRQANADFAGASRNIDAIDAGQTAAMRGRTEDTIPAFQALSPRGQQAFRTGYADPLIADAQKAAPGVNKARPLLNDALQDEAAAMAPGNDLMQRRLAREQTMFTTRNQALGGSRTADNLADADALGIDPSVVGHIVSGNWGGAVRSLIHAGSRAVTGNTPAVREAVANILLQHGANVTPTNLERMVGETVRKIQTVQNLAINSARVGAGALAVSPSATKKPEIFRKANR
jgi:hypothetical protein